MDVIPAKAGIQYAGKAEINSVGCDVLGRPVPVRNCAQGRAMTAEYDMAFSRHVLPEVC